MGIRIKKEKNKEKERGRKELVKNVTHNRVGLRRVARMREEKAQINRQQKENSANEKNV